ncbi:hypothetical protein [Actinomyces faecalis]|uniref:variant leucine-rich repeat-containing protein n=1 Tax=Actinomyces faecalis TaxID=2722820 RepID=UPI00155457F9|nr:hypothetical protein [Actinomyces faecalis]
MDSEQTRLVALAADQELASTTTDFALQAAIAQNRPDLVEALARNTSLYDDLRTWVDEQLAGSGTQASEPAEDQAGTTAQPAPADALTCAAGTTSSAAGSHGSVLAVAAALAADADVATSTADFELQAAIAQHRPDLHSALSFNPLLYPDLRQWLEATGRDAAGAGVAEADPPYATSASVAGASTPEASEPVAGTLPAPVSTVLDAVPAALSPAPAPAAGPTPVPVAVSAPGASDAGPGEPPLPSSTSLSRQRTWLAAAVVILLLVLVGGGTAWYVSTRGQGFEVAGSTSDQDSIVGEETQEPSGDATRCGQDPDVNVTDVEDTASGLRVRLDVKATCEGGDVLSGAQNVVSLYAPSSTSGSGDADSLVALGHVDFSASPVGLAPQGQGTIVHITFGSAQYFRPAAELDPSSMKAVLSLDRSGVESAPVTSQGPSFTALATGGDAAQADSAAAAALTWQEAKDYDTIVSRVNGTWVPQISSKRPGLVLDGETWDNRMVWEHYLRTRAVYPKALLLNSDSWSVFDAGGHWWVIIVAEPYPTPEGANGWCDAQGISKDDCFAKQISVGGSSEGTTRLR